MRRPYRISGFIQNGVIGDGGLSYRIGTRYASEEAAVARVRRYINEGWGDPPKRYLITKHAGEACWVTSDGEVVRRDLDELPWGAGLWGCTS